MAVRVGVNRRVARDTTEDGDVRPARLVQDRQQRQGDRDGHPGQGGREDDAGEGGHRQQEVGPSPGEIAAQLAKIDESKD